MPPGISGSTASSTRRLDERDLEAIPRDAAKPAGRSVSGQAPVPTAAQDAHSSQASRDAVANLNDGILYVGMNEKSMQTESDALRKATRHEVRSIFCKAGATVELDGTSYDLKDEEQIKAFAEALAKRNGLSEETKSALATVLRRATSDGRDELAQIAMVWARSEDGKSSVPSRLVISGHHGGYGFSGGLSENDVFALASVFPKAARQIEDVHFAGCMSEMHVNARSDIQRAFPNLKTVWGYSGYSPKAPVHHLLAWQSATRGRKDVIGGASVPGHESAVAWSSKGGIVGKQRSLEELRREAKNADDRFEGYKSGLLRSTIVTDDDYATYQAIAQSNASPSEKAAATAKAAVLLRVRKYDHVREKFEATYGARIRAACAKAGVEAPRFAALSRKDALERIDAIKDKVAAFDPDLRAKLDGLAKLDPNVVEEGWCY